MLRRSILVFATLIFAIPGALAGGFIDLTVGHSRVVEANGTFGTVIVGDPTIADADVGTPGTIILTGKTLGSTNLIVLDQTGSQILSSTLQVGPVDRRPRSTVRILKGGSNAQEFVCIAGSRCAASDGADAAAPPPAQDEAAAAAGDGENHAEVRQ